MSSREPKKTGKDTKGLRMTNEERGAGAHRSPEEIAIDIVIRLGLLGLFVYWSLQIIGPFVMVVAWSVILTVATYPVYSWLEARLGGRGGLAALLITLLGFAIILGPAAALAISLFESVQVLATGLKEGTLTIPPPSESVRDWPLIGEKLYDLWNLAATNLVALLGSYSSVILSAGGSFLGKVAGLGGGVLMFAASVLIAGFLYRPGPVLAQATRRFATRIVGDRGENFVNLAGATIRNVSRGVIGISLLQALLAGVGLMLAGVPGAGLIALGVLILGIVQIGPGILLLPVIIWVWTAMDTITALIFTLFMVPVTFMDNFLKPIVMARGLATPMLVIFIGVIGGTLAYGLVGLFIGPIVLAVFYELLVAWVDAGTPDAGAEDET
jgi:predicted PurR-regulated permease PerM